MLSLSYTRLFRIIIEMFVGSGDAVESGSAARHYKAGIISSCPVPPLTGTVADQLARNGFCAASLARELWLRDETSRVFSFLCNTSANTLRDETYGQTFADEEVWLQLERLSWHNELLSAELYGLTDTDMKLLDELYGHHPVQYGKGTEEGSL